MEIIGIDVGGTKIAAGIVSDNKIKKIVSTKTNANAKKEVITSQVVNLVDKLINKNIKGIGIGIPGIVDSEKGFIFETPNIKSWKNVPIKKILEKKYKIPVLINNDASCFALGEKYFGAGKKYKNMVGLIVGTGFGAGVIIDGKIYSGNTGGAGEFGQIKFRDHNIEYYCSGNYFLKEHKKTGKELQEKAAKKDKKTLKIFNKFGENLGKGIAVIVRSIDPELIVLGGGASKGYTFFEKSMRTSLKKLIPKISYSKLKIKQSKLKHAGVIGAACLHFNYKK